MSQEEHQIISFRLATIIVWLNLHSPPTDVNTYDRCKIKLKLPFALIYALLQILDTNFHWDDNNRYIVNILKQDSSRINLVIIDNKYDIHKVHTFHGNITNKCHHKLGQ